MGDLTEHGWDHGLGEIVTALIDAGLRIEALVEHPFLYCKVDSPRRGAGRHLAAATRGRRWVPLMFSLRATKSG